MKRQILATLALLAIFQYSSSQQLVSPMQLEPDVDFENIWSSKIFSDSLSTSVVIWIKNSVRLHKHANHTEHVYVLDGSADMKLGDENLSIVGGDLIIIPKNTAHSLKVTSPGPLKVISFQSPEFTGKDRVFLDENR